MRKRPKDNAISKMLREQPIDKRAQMIVEIFSIIAAEFAMMVLEHVKPEPGPRARGRDRSRARPTSRAPAKPARDRNASGARGH
jgi:hypothetical protein